MSPSTTTTTTASPSSSSSPFHGSHGPRRHRRRSTPQAPRRGRKRNRQLYVDQSDEKDEEYRSTAIEVEDLGPTSVHTRRSSHELVEQCHQSPQGLQEGRRRRRRRESSGMKDLIGQQQQQQQQQQQRKRVEHLQPEMYFESAVQAAQKGLPTNDELPSSKKTTSSIIGVQKSVELHRDTSFVGGGFCGVCGQGMDKQSTVVACDMCSKPYHRRCLLSRSGESLGGEGYLCEKCKKSQEVSNRRGKSESKRINGEHSEDSLVDNSFVRHEVVQPVDVPKTKKRRKRGKDEKHAKSKSGPVDSNASNDTQQKQSTTTKPNSVDSRFTASDPQQMSTTEDVSTLEHRSVPAHLRDDAFVNKLQRSMDSLARTSVVEVSCRDEQRRCLRQFIEQRLRTTTGGTILLAGKPGTGKSQLVTQVLRREMQFNSDTYVTMVNCVSITSEKALIKALFPEFVVPVTTGWNNVEKGLRMMPATERNKIQRGIFENVLRKQKNDSKNMFILFCDEFESLKPKMLQTLLGWTHQPSRLVVIAVVNKPNIEEELSSDVSSSITERIMFSAYTRQEMVSIVQDRLAKANASDLFDKRALEMLGSKAEGTGDARIMLDMTRKAVENKLAAVLHEGNGGKANYSTIRVPDAHKVCQVFGSAITVKTIGSLVRPAQLMLCVALNLFKVSARDSTFTVSQLMAHYMEMYRTKISTGTVQNTTSENTLLDTIQRLENSDLLTVERGRDKKHAHAQDKKQCNLSLKVDEATVLKALQGKAFFKNIIDAPSTRPSYITAASATDTNTT